MRLTQPLVQVAEVLMSDPSGRHWGYDLSRRARVRSGVLYPMLHRMLDQGWLKDGWEEIPGGKRQAPPRRYYELTPAGCAELGALLARARAESRLRVAVLRPGVV
jgi:PadR family transcriptional regulator PadR